MTVSQVNFAYFEKLWTMNFIILLSAHDWLIEKYESAVIFSKILKCWHYNGVLIYIPTIAITNITTVTRLILFSHYVKESMSNRWVC